MPALSDTSAERASGGGGCRLRGARRKAQQGTKRFVCSISRNSKRFTGGFAHLPEQRVMRHAVATLHLLALYVPCGGAAAGGRARDGVIV